MHNETILCVAPRDWFGLWKDTQSIMVRIAAQNRVLYFDPGRDAQKSALSEMMDNFPNLFSINTQEVNENLTVVATPPSIPYARRHLPRSLLRVTMPIVISINTKILIRHIRRVMKRFKVKNPILWLYTPYHEALIGKFGEKIVCYYNYDEFASFVSNQRISDTIQRYEADLCKRVDVVLTTSRAQYDVRKNYNPNTHFVPNAVDFDLFNRALQSNLPVPDDIKDIHHPIIGYAGRLGTQVDVTLLRRVAEAYPNYSLVLVGPDELPHSQDERVLRTLSNVHFLGWKKPSDLPSYLQVFDAALIPYPLVGHVLYGYPTKLHEYLAAGRSVVATAMPELLPYSDVLRIGKNDDEFISLVEEAINDKSTKAIEQRVSVAKENTWDKRVADIYRILQPMLGIHSEKKA